jgi:hypothetical protein
MTIRHFLAVGVSVGTLGGVFGCWNSLAMAQMEAAPVTTVSPTQQMPVYGVPAAYPSTADPAMAPAAYPSAYPSTSDRATAPAAPALPSELPDGNLSPVAPGPIYTPYGSPEAMTASLTAARDSQAELLLNSNETWQWQILPTGLMYKSYLAGDREPRLGGQLVYERKQGWLLDATLGGRVGVLRYGTDNDLWPQGWQLDIEGAAFPRLDQDRNLVENDYRAGVPLTTRQGPWEMKVGYYHYCSHIGDLYLLANPDFQRINYVRDTIIWGLAVHLNPDVRLYAEAGWAFRIDGGAEPWEFQFGAEFSPAIPTSIRGAPFFAINGHLHQEDNFSGNVTVQTGWQWRGRTGHLLRIGVQYFNGMSDQAQFFDKSEEQIGMGLWYDF